MQRGRQGWGEDLMYCITITMTLRVHIGLITPPLTHPTDMGLNPTHVVGPTHTTHVQYIYVTDIKWPLCASEE